MFSPTPELLPDDECLAGGRHPVLPDPAPHTVLGTPITGPWLPHQKSVIVGIGCFWGVERIFWQTPGVESTSVGYAGGPTLNPTYREVCSGRTNHAEVVEVVYDPSKISFDELIKIAMESHDPTQRNRQGNDRGTQYRSVIYTVGEDAQEEASRARAIVDGYAKDLAAQGYGEGTTEIRALDRQQYYLAEDEHQQYLDKVPNGYCPHHATGVACSLPEKS